MGIAVENVTPDFAIVCERAVIGSKRYFDTFSAAKAHLCKEAEGRVVDAFKEVTCD